MNCMMGLNDINAEHGLIIKRVICLSANLSDQGCKNLEKTFRASEDKEIELIKVNQFTYDTITRGLHSYDTHEVIHDHNVWLKLYLQLKVIPTTTEIIRGITGSDKRVPHSSPLSSSAIHFTCRSKLWLVQCLLLVFAHSLHRISVIRFQRII